MLVVGFHWGARSDRSIAMYTPEVEYAAVDAGAEMIMGSPPPGSRQSRLQGKADCYSWVTSSSTNRGGSTRGGGSPEQQGPQAQANWTSTRSTRSGRGARGESTSDAHEDRHIRKEVDRRVAFLLPSSSTAGPGPRSSRRRPRPSTTWHVRGEITESQTSATRSRSRVTRSSSRRLTRLRIEPDVRGAVCRPIHRIGQGDRLANQQIRVWHGIRGGYRGVLVAPCLQKPIRGEWAWAGSIAASPHRVRREEASHSVAAHRFRAVRHADSKSESVLAGTSALRPPVGGRGRLLTVA